ncbi:MAG: procyclic acidic repetitive family protein, partial [Anaerolineae bacterium]|nr:procyclic acidic repetitive family protein [Anaerolineae bacterium]
KVGSPTLIIREDIAETNDDAEYRATAISLVQGLTTYMSWQDYQTAMQVEGANLQLVAVDGGNGCVVPSAETIADMSYPYTINHQLIVPQNTLARSEVQGLIWFLFQEGVYEQFGFIERDDLADFREALQTAFTDAITASLTPETTPEAEVTPDAEVTPNAETPPTSEVTPDAEVTPETEPTSEVEVTPETETTPAP